MSTVEIHLGEHFRCYLVATSRADENTYAVDLDVPRGDGEDQQEPAPPGEHGARR
jgi:hypothetical protein